MSECQNCVEKRGASRLGQVFVAVVVIVLLGVGYSLNWDYSRIGNWPIAQKIGALFTGERSLQDVEKSLTKTKTNLVSQKAVQDDLLQKSLQTHASLEALYERLGQSIVAAEKNGSQVAFADRMLSIDAAKEQIVLLVNSMLSTKNEVNFRRNVVEKIDDAVSMITEKLQEAELAASVVEAAEILKDVDSHRDEFDNIIAEAKRPFVGPVTGTILTEKALVEYVSQQRPTSRNKVDAEELLREFREPSSDDVSVPEVPVVKTIPVTLTESTTEIDDGTMIILRVNAKSGDVEPVRVK